MDWMPRCAAFVLAAAWFTGSLHAAAEGVTVREVDGKVRVEVNGSLFTEYHYQNVSRPFLYPVLGPGDLPMTRNWPMKEAPGEDRDHPHHRSLWWTHGAVNGVDFWSEGTNAGRTVHDRFLNLQSGPDTGVIHSRNFLVAKDGRRVGTVEFILTFHRRSEDRVLDWETKVTASEGDLTFGDTKEGTMAIRLNETMRLKPNKENVGQPKGRIVTSEGVRDDDTWGKRAAWVDYQGLVQGELLGVAIFDHPSNPRHPTWWHVRDYGLFAANPFGIHDFERKPAGTGDLVVARGENLGFRYRFVFHRGNEQAAGVAALFQEFAKATPAR